MSRITWNQFKSIPNGTRIFNHGADECVALANHFHENVLGGSFIWVGSAHQWWTTNQPEINRLYTKSSKPVAGALLVSRGGIYDRTHGHIGGVVSETYTDGSFDTIEQNAGTGARRYVYRYRRPQGNGMLGFLVPKNNPAGKPAPLQPHQRRADPSAPVKRRSEPSSKSKDLGRWIQPNEVGDFDGWIRGESVGGNNVWFRGISGNWFWSGGFTSQVTNGLKDLNPVSPPKPPAVAANQRKAFEVPVNVRATPNTSAKITGSIAANAVITPEGWVTGQKVELISVWFKVAGGYAWGGGFTKSTGDGLKNLNPAVKPPVDPPVITDPTGPENSDVGPGPVLKHIDNWNKAAAPDWGSTNFDRPTPASVFLKFPLGIVESTVRPDRGYYHGREGKPNHFGLHHAAGPSLEGVVTSLMGDRDVSANAVIKDHEIVHMVDTRDTPSTNGRWRSNQFSVTVEVCNNKTTTDKPSPESHETAAWYIAREALSWGMKYPLARGENVFGHKELSKSATACPGELDMDWITRRANDIIKASEESTPVPKPDYSDLLESISGLTKVITSLIDLLKKIFRV